MVACFLSGPNSQVNGGTSAEPPIPNTPISVRNQCDFSSTKMLDMTNWTIVGGTTTRRPLKPPSSAPRYEWRVKKAHVPPNSPYDAPLPPAPAVFELDEPMAPLSRWIGRICLPK